MSAMNPSSLDPKVLVEQMLSEAADAGRASDIHVEPTAGGYEVRLRVDGLLQAAMQLDAGVGRAIGGTADGLVQLLTYRLDIPQEGRMDAALPDGQTLQTRVAIMPTSHGLRAAVRMPAELVQPRDLDALGLPEPTLRGCDNLPPGTAGCSSSPGPRAREKQRRSTRCWRTSSRLSRD